MGKSVNHPLGVTLDGVKEKAFFPPRFYFENSKIAEIERLEPVYTTHKDSQTSHTYIFVILTLVFLLSQSKLNCRHGDTLFLNILTFSLEEQSAYFVYVNAIITTKKFKI